MAHIGNIVRLLALPENIKKRQAYLDLAKEMKLNEVKQELEEANKRDYTEEEIIKYGMM